MDTVHAPEPEHAPPHPPNSEPEDGVAMRLTAVPPVKFAVQVAPVQLRPDGELLTAPLPVPAIVTLKAYGPPALLGLVVKGTPAWAGLAPSRTTAETGIVTSERQADLRVVQRALENKVVAQKLRDYGVTPADVVLSENKWRLLRYWPRAAGPRRKDSSALQTPLDHRQCLCSQVGAAFQTEGIYVITPTLRAARSRRRLNFSLSASGRGGSALLP